MLGDYGQGHAGRARCLDEPVGRRQGDVDRLFHDKVLGRLGRADADLGVQAARHADADHVDVRPSEQRFQVGFGRATTGGGEGGGGTGGHVGYRHQAGAGQGRDRVRVHGRDHPGADDAETAGHRASSHLVSSSRCWGSATSGSSISGCQRFSHSTEIQCG